MADGLVERLMHLSSDERDISVHQFFAGQQEVATGNLTVTQVKTYYSMTAADIADYDALIAATPGTSTTALKIDRINYIQRVHAVFILAEKGNVPGYTTPAEVRTKLGIPQQ